MLEKMTKTLFFVMVGILSGCNSSDKQPASEATKAVNQDTIRSAQPTTAAVSDKKTILFFGNSLTAGYGLEPAQSFPALIQQRIDSLGLPYRAVTARY
jgi:acyl-CoA thioesterase-1